MLALVPMAVLVAHLSANRPVVPLPFRPGRTAAAVVTILTKVQGKDSIVLRRPTAWVSHSTLMETLLWTQWQMCIVNSNINININSSSSSNINNNSNSNRWLKQGKPNKHRRHRRCKRPCLHQCNTSSPQLSSNNCKLLVVSPHGLDNVRLIHMCRPLLGRLRPPLRCHSSTRYPQQRNSSLRTPRLRMYNPHIHMRTRRHRYTMPLSWATGCSSRHNRQRNSSSSSRGSNSRCNTARRAREVETTIRRSIRRMHNCRHPSSNSYSDSSSINRLRMVVVATGRLALAR